MSSIARSRGVTATLCALLLAGGLATEAHAQNATIGGRVTNDAGAPLVGATVFIQSLNLGTQAGADGSYTLVVPEANARGQEITIMARQLGFKPVMRQITLSSGSQTQNFSLEADPFRLEELIISGVADATSQRMLSFSVARVSEDQLTSVPANSPIKALQGKVSGVRIGTGTGAPGSSPVVRLRGSTNLGIGGSGPMVIVDGVITGSSLADIDANNIESLEVLKGPAAASFYGSDAANGVINITTKRGANLADGTTHFSVRSEYGQSGLQREYPVARYHPYELDGNGEILLTSGGDRVPDADGIMDNPYPTTGPNRFRNQIDEWMENGAFYSTNFQLGVRRGNTNVFSSFTLDRNQGIVPFQNGQLRRNARINVDQGIGETADISVSAQYGINTNDYDGGTGWFELMQAPPDVDLQYPNSNFPDSEFHPLLPGVLNGRANPLYNIKNHDYNSRRERIIGSVTGRWRPMDWLRLEGTYGTDRLNSRTRNYRFRGYLGEAGQATPGSMSINAVNNVAYNAQASAIASRRFGDLNSVTRLTYLWEQSDNQSTGGGGNTFIVNALPDMSALSSGVNVSSGLTQMRTRDLFIAQDFDYRDRYILSALYRRDGSSLFGADARWSDFYRVSGAYIISEDFQMRGIDNLKIRAARGTAGLRPGFSYQYETYSISGGSVSKEALGNRDLRPAVVTENEFGLDVAFLGRFNAEVVYAARETDGAFVEVGLPVALTGGYRTQWQNAATISANTWEFMLNALVVNRPNLTYNLTLTVDRTRQMLDDYGRAAEPINAGGQSQGVFRYESGQPLGIIYGNRFVRNPQELTDNPAFTGNVGDYVVNPDGYVVLGSSRGTPTEAPVKYVAPDGAEMFVIGDVNPDFGFGIANTLSWNNFTVYALFSGLQGGDIYNFTRQWMYQDFRHGFQTQADRAPADKIALGFYSAGMYNGNVANDHFVEDGSYIKLNELSVSYTFGTDILSRLRADRYVRGVKLALIGRNLYTWTDYSGFDPDVTSGGDFNFRIDGFRYPNFRQISGQIELTF